MPTIVIYEHGQQIEVESITLYDCGTVVTIYPVPEEFTDTDCECTRIETVNTTLEVVKNERVLDY